MCLLVLQAKVSDCRSRLMSRAAVSLKMKVSFVFFPSVQHQN